MYVLMFEKTQELTRCAYRHNNISDIKKKKIATLLHCVISFPLFYEGRDIHWKTDDPPYCGSSYIIAILSTLFLPS